MSGNSNYDISSRSYTIPRGLMALDFLSFSEKMIINRIIGLSAKYINKGGCTLSNGAISEIIGCTPGTVSVAISKAAWLGFVTKREDTLDKYENGNGTIAITQTRRIVMVMPDFFEYLGELWGEGHYAQNKDAREVLKQVNILLTESFKKSSKENSGIEIAINSLLSCLLTEDGIQDYLNTPKRNFFCPPKEKSLGPLIKNPSLFKFWETKVLGNQSSGKRLRECPLRSHSLPDGDEKEKNSDGVVIRRERMESPAKQKPIPEPKQDNTPYDEIHNSWNHITKDSGMPAVRQLTSGRKKHIRARMKLLPELSDWVNLFEIMITRPFLCGDSPRGWKADLDFVIKNEEKIVKILEGGYADSPTKPKRSSRSENPHTKESTYLNNDPDKFKNIVVEEFYS